MKFGDIDSTRFGFRSNKDDKDKPCFCWLISTLKISILQDKSKKGFENLNYMATHDKKMECSEETYPTDDYEASFGTNPFSRFQRELKIKWTTYKLCGKCERDPNPLLAVHSAKGCAREKRLCIEIFETGKTAVPITLQKLLKKLWELRSTLDQKETVIKGILKDIKKKFKKCDPSKMACDQTKSFCEGKGKFF